MYIKHWVLWDGECGLCRRIASWGRRHDRQKKLRIVAYQNVPSPPMTSDLYRDCRDSLHVVKADGTILRAGKASLFVLEQLGWGPARLLILPPFIWIVEIGYRMVANHRDFVARFVLKREPEADPNEKG